MLRLVGVHHGQGPPRLFQTPFCVWVCVARLFAEVNRKVCGNDISPISIDPCWLCFFGGGMFFCAVPPACGPQGCASADLATRRSMPRRLASVHLLHHSPKGEGGGQLF